MRIDIPYGKGKQTLEVADARLHACLLPSHRSESVALEEDIVRAALDAPIGAPALRMLAAGRKNILAITSDHTRPMPSRITLPLLLREIRLGQPDAQVTVLIATGMHRSPTQAELRERFGDALLAQERIIVHDATDAANLEFFGRLPSGGELWLNKLVREADLVVAEGFIEPHFFAGFSGGRKSILPGVAGKATVLYNHNAGFIAHPLARQGSLEGNPIHRDMAFAAEQAKLAFILNVLLDGDKRIVAAVAGDAAQAHEAGCTLCGEMTRVSGTQADIVVTSNGGYPLDQNIYQSVKGLTAAEACVRPGGAVIICAALGDGHGGEDFYHWFSDRAAASEVARDICNVPPEQTRMDQWQAQILARVMEKATCFFVTGEENRGMIEDMHMRWAGNVNDALAMATALLGEDSSVVVIPDGVGVIVSERRGGCP